MTVDRSHIRVTAMPIAPNREGTAHLVSVNGATSEDPDGYHRLVGGSVELGETHRQAVIREVREELDADIVDLARLGCIENIFHHDGDLRHEVVFLSCGLFDPMPPARGGTLTEVDGSVVPVVWRRADDPQPAPPLYPAPAMPFVQAALVARRG